MKHPQVKASTEQIVKALEGGQTYYEQRYKERLTPGERSRQSFLLL